MTDVLVVGAGPVGLVVAAELRRHGASVRIIDAMPEPQLYCRAIGVTPRTLEVYEAMGIADRMIDAGLWLDGLRLEVRDVISKTQHVDLSDLPYAALGLPQPDTERLLTAHLSGFGVTIERGVTFASLKQSPDHIAIELTHPDGRREDARFSYVVGCDGAHSAVRHALGLRFDGEAFPYPFMLGDVKVEWPADAATPRGYALRALITHADAPPDMFIAIPLPEPDRYRISMTADQPMSGDAKPDAGDSVAHGVQTDLPGPALADLQSVADRVMASPPKLSDLRWSSFFRISMRLAGQYRVDRAFIAGDAAHIHPPTGGQGMNTGIQDGYNLAWKLGLVIAGKAHPRLLDSYEAERRPVAEDVIARTTEESINLGNSGPPKHRLADTQILVNYRDQTPGHDHGSPAPSDAPLAGDRAPDATGLRRKGVGFPLRMFELMRGVTYNLVVAVASDDKLLEQLATISGTLADIGLPVRIIAIADATASGLGFDEQPYGVVLVQDNDGRFTAAYQATAGAAFLVRPDGYIAWTARPLDEVSLRACLHHVATGA